MAKNKYYVVWKGLNSGVYDNWAECKMQVEGQEGAKYKSFETREEAVEAFEKGYTHYLKTASSAKAAANLAPKAPVGKPIRRIRPSMFGVKFSLRKRKVNILFFRIRLIATRTALSS